MQIAAAIGKVHSQGADNKHQPYEYQTSGFPE